MFPIRDHNPSARRPVVVYALIAINIAVFLVEYPYFSDPRALATLWRNWALIPAAVTEYGEMTGLFTSMFLHGGVMHLLGNMLFLWIFGDNLEDQLGRLGFLAFYLACGILAGLAHILADPSSVVPTVGASGAVSGVLGGYLLLYPRARVDVLVIFIVFFRVFALPAWVMLGLWFGMQIFGGIVSGSEGGGVAYWAHAGGFVAGLIAMVPLWLRRGGGAYWSATHGHPPHPAAEYGQTRIPRVRRRR